jgi:hypothetical protein
MRATRSSETSVFTTPTRRHIPEDDTLHIHLLQEEGFLILLLFFQLNISNFCLISNYNNEI